MFYVLRSVPSPSKLPLIAINDASPGKGLNFQQTLGLQHKEIEKGRKRYAWSSSAAQGHTARRASGRKMAIMCIPSVADDVVVRFDRLVEYHTQSANSQSSRARSTSFRTTARSTLVRQAISQRRKGKHHIVPSMKLAHSSSHAPQPPSPLTSSPPPTLSPPSLAFLAIRHTPPTSPPLEHETGLSMRLADHVAAQSACHEWQYRSPVRWRTAEPSQRGLRLDS